MLTPGAAVALVPARAATAGVRDWLGACGKTQLAVYAAESLWQSGEVTLLVWVVASNRASVLTSYVQTALSVLGSDATGDADAIGARFAGRVRPCPGSSGCWPTGSRRSARTTRAPPRPAGTWATP